MSIKIQKTSDGRSNLHIWRTGQSYYKQKSALFLKEWTNVMFSPLPYPSGGDISYYDIRQPLPFADNTFDAVYAFHIIEHLTPLEANRFVAEIHRILKPIGICRLSTPDLENICREYVKNLQRCLSDPSAQNLLRYDWNMLELYDQLVREKSGGMMSEAVRDGYYDPQYAQERYGDVFAEFYAPPSSGKNKSQASPSARIKNFFGQSPKQQLSQLYWKIENFLFRLLRNFKSWTMKGDPCQTMEANKWFYDRLSLKLLMEKRGLEGVEQKTFFESDIPHWEKYNFDKSNFGHHAVEPSLYMEGRQPL